MPRATRSTLKKKDKRAQCSRSSDPRHRQNRVSKPKDNRAECSRSSDPRHRQSTVSKPKDNRAECSRSSDPRHCQSTVSKPKSLSIAIFIINLAKKIVTTPTEEDTTVVRFPLTRSARSAGILSNAIVDHLGGSKMYDPFLKTESTVGSDYRKPAFITDPRMTSHKCSWDKDHPESPERYTSVLERLKQLGYLRMMTQLVPREATEEELLMLHTQDIINIIKATAGTSEEDILEELSSQYEAIFMNDESWKIALLAAGCAMELVDQICCGVVPSGFALVRPPGHHAGTSEFNGYCFFNNVSLSAMHAIQRHNVQRVLIIDWDVHHGQGTQRLFYSSAQVLYVSIHRYEHGKFWPNLAEGNVDHVGEGEGEGKNVNIPLNAIGMGNAEYAAIWQRIILPMANEFRPELVLVSAGYDSALGDEKGEMTVTPAFFAHMLWPLKCLASGKIAVILEGGYCIESLSEGAALTARALIGLPCPNIEPLGEPHREIVTVINDVMHAHQGYWKCFAQTGFENEVQIHAPNLMFFESPPPPAKHVTRNGYPVQPPEVREELLQQLALLKQNTKLTFAPNRVCYAYDREMSVHTKRRGGAYEDPLRIVAIYNKLREYNLLGKLKHVPSRSATMAELQLVHTAEHLANMQAIALLPEIEQKAAEKNYNSMTFCEDMFRGALLSCGNLLEVVDEVMTQRSGSGVAIVRPPGHHACQDTPAGFCFVNNVAVAARYAIRNHGCQRVLIVDWDIHHGNGTQKILYEDNNVLYISIHLFLNGTFYPNSMEGGADHVGSGNGTGFNVNIPWDDTGLGDSDYLSAFTNIVMPIAYEFNPDLVIVSCGFDAGVFDSIGKFHVTPEAFAHFTHYLSALAGGKLILALEGGYNKNTIAMSMTSCVKAMLGHPIPPLEPDNYRTAHTVLKVMQIQKQYWKSLQFTTAVRPTAGKMEVTTVTMHEQAITLGMDDLGVAGVGAGDAAAAAATEK